MVQNAVIILIIGAFFAWQFYKHRKAIWHSMNLYGNYMADVMREKTDGKKKKNERR